MMELFVGLGIGILIALIAYFVLGKKNSTQNNEELLSMLELKMQMMMPELMKSSNELLVNIADQKLKGEKNEIRADMESKRSEIQRMVQMIAQELKFTQEKLNKSDQERIGSFNSLKSSLDDYKQITQQLAVSTEGLKSVLSNNQLRGQFGEQIAEDLLRMCGFVKGTDYYFNKEQEGSATRPDFTVLLPDGMKINVDSKFPYSNLQKLSEAQDDASKQEYERAFRKDVKEKIKQVTTRDYINPEDNTVDFVILFIPNEMIFSYVYDKMNDIWLDAMGTKVVLAGPFSFTAILRMVRQAYEHFRYKDNLQGVIRNVQMFEKEFYKFYEEFDKIGMKIQSLDKQYQTVKTTRVNQLVRRVNELNIEDGTKKDSDTFAQINLLNDNLEIEESPTSEFKNMQ